MSFEIAYKNANDTILIWMKYWKPDKETLITAPIGVWQMSLILLLLTCSFSSSRAQVSAINNDAGNDYYGVLRGMVGQQSSSLSESDFSHTHCLHGHNKSYIKFFIGPQSFIMKGDLDIYNHVVYGDFDNLGNIRPYQIEKGRIDSLHLLLQPKAAPISIYMYDAKEDQFGKVIHQGRYNIVEGVEFEFRKGSFNPAVDSEPRADQVVVKKSNYLIDSGIWHKIPKSKKDIVEFIRLHFKKRIDKSKIKGKKSIEVVIKMN